MQRSLCSAIFVLLYVSPALSQAERFVCSQPQRYAHFLGGGTSKVCVQVGPSTINGQKGDLWLVVNHDTIHNGNLTGYVDDCTIQFSSGLASSEYTTGGLGLELKSTNNWIGVHLIAAAIPDSEINEFVTYKGTLVKGCYVHKIESYQSNQDRTIIFQMK